MKNLNSIDDAVKKINIPKPKQSSLSIFIRMSMFIFFTSVVIGLSIGAGVRLYTWMVYG